MTEKRIGRYWISYGRTEGIALGFNISKWTAGVDFLFWWIGIEF
jgi:hypothetical protein